MQQYYSWDWKTFAAGLKPMPRNRLKTNSLTECALVTHLRILHKAGNSLPKAVHTFPQDVIWRLYKVVNFAKIGGFGRFC